MRPESVKRLATRLRAAGLRCRIARRGLKSATVAPDTFTLRAGAPEDWQTLLEACADDAPIERIVYLWNLDTQLSAGDASIGTDAAAAP